MVHAEPCQCVADTAAAAAPPTHAALAPAAGTSANGVTSVNGSGSGCSYDFNVTDHPWDVTCDMRGMPSSLQSLLIRCPANCGIRQDGVSVCGSGAPARGAENARPFRPHAVVPGGAAAGAGAALRASRCRRVGTACKVGTKCFQGPSTLRMPRCCATLPIPFRAVLQSVVQHVLSGSARWRDRQRGRCGAGSPVPLATQRVQRRAGRRQRSDGLRCPLRPQPLRGGCCGGWRTLLALQPPLLPSLQVRWRTGTRQAIVARTMASSLKARRKTQWAPPPPCWAAGRAPPWQRSTPQRQAAPSPAPATAGSPGTC